MEEYLQKCKLLDTIDIPFLEKLSQTEEWDSLFYELFELLVSVRKTTEEFFIYNKDRLLFFRSNDIPEIEIRESTELINENQESELVLVVNQKKDAQQSVLTLEIIDYLEKNQVDFKIIDYLSKPNLLHKDIVKVISITRHN